MRALVLGGGPAGATAGYWLAAHGIEVTVLEKTAFPREKVCGDGLTPRAVKELVAMGVPTREKDGWIPPADLKVPVSDIASTLESLLGGKRVTQFQRGNQQYDVLVQVEDAKRVTPSDLSKPILG